MLWCPLVLSLVPAKAPCCLRSSYACSRWFCIPRSPLFFSCILPPPGLPPRGAAHLSPFHPMRSCLPPFLPAHFLLPWPLLIALPSHFLSPLSASLSPSNPTAFVVSIRQFALSPTAPSLKRFNPIRSLTLLHAHNTPHRPLVGGDGARSFYSSFADLCPGSSNTIEHLAGCLELHEAPPPAPSTPTYTWDTVPTNFSFQSTDPSPIPYECLLEASESCGFVEAEHPSGTGADGGHRTLDVFVDPETGAFAHCSPECGDALCRACHRCAAPSCGPDLRPRLAPAPAGGPALRPPSSRAFANDLFHSCPLLSLPPPPPPPISSFRTLVMATVSSLLTEISQHTASMYSPQP